MRVELAGLCRRAKRLDPDVSLRSEDDLRVIPRGIWQGGESQSVCIVSGPGMGKTHVVQTLKQKPSLLGDPDDRLPAWVVVDAPTDKPSRERVADRAFEKALAEGLRRFGEARSDWRAAMRTLRQGRGIPTLIVIDGFESWVRYLSCGLLGELRMYDNQKLAHILAFSREFPNEIGKLISDSKLPDIFASGTSCLPPVSPDAIAAFPKMAQAAPIPIRDALWLHGLSGGVPAMAVIAMEEYAERAHPDEQLPDEQWQVLREAIIRGQDMRRQAEKTWNIMPGHLKDALYAVLDADGVPQHVPPKDLADLREVYSLVAIAPDSAGYRVTSYAIERLARDLRGSSGFLKDWYGRAVRAMEKGVDYLERNPGPLHDFRIAFEALSGANVCIPYGSLCIWRSLTELIRLLTKRFEHANAKAIRGSPEELVRFLAKEYGASEAFADFLVAMHRSIEEAAGGTAPMCQVEANIVSLASAIAFFLERTTGGGARHLSGMGREGPSILIPSAQA